MTTIVLRTFNGMVKGLNPELLGDEFAQDAVNTKLIYGDLRPWKETQTITTPTKAGTKQTIYRFGENETDESRYWFTWTTDVDVVRAPIDNDTTERTYFTGDGYPKVTTAARATTDTNYPSNAYRLGVPPPNVSTVVLGVSGSPTSDTAIASSVAYVITYVSSVGEESAPSDPTDVVSFQPGQTIALTNLPTGSFASPYNSLSNVDVATKRIYRSNAGSKGTDFQFVAEIPLAQASYNDSALAEDLQEVVETWGWVPPPESMVGLKLMANGIGVGFSGNTLYLSEPFALYAYPIAYQISTDSPIVGLGAFGQSIFVGTKANPYILSGTDPASLTMIKLEMKQACVSKRSIVEMSGGVVYASPDGIVRVGPDGISMLTTGLIPRDEWQEYNPSSIHAYELDGRYFAFYDNGTEQGCLVFEFAMKPSIHKLDLYATAGYNDRLRDALYLAVDGDIVKWDHGTDNLTMTWRSKKFRTPYQQNMGAVKIGADAYPVTFKLYANGSLKSTLSIGAEQVYKLPAGYKADRFEFEVVASDQINYIAVSETVRGIRQVNV